MILLFLGAPGSGKGTQSKFICDKYGIPQLSTGDILRNAIKEQTSVGLKAKKFMEEGKLVPDVVMTSLISARFSLPDCSVGFILDGFPRTTEQAKVLDATLATEKKKIHRVIYFKLDLKLLIARITGRLIAPVSGKEYHEQFNPPRVSGICDVSGEMLVRRPDDTEEKAKVRLKVFEEQTLPLVNYYKADLILREIDASASIDDVRKQLEFSLTN